MVVSAYILSQEAKEDLQVFAENIVQARLARGWSQQEVAERALMSRLTYREIEKGNPKVRFLNYLSVLDLFGLTGGLRELAASHTDEEGRRLRNIKGRHS